MSPRTLRAWWMPDTWDVVVLPDPAAVDEHPVAEILVRHAHGPLHNVALASGATFAGFFAALRGRVDSGRARFDGVAFHHLDEFEGLPPDAPGSLAREIGEALFPDRDPRRGTFHPVDARREDAAQAHEAALERCDLLFAGIGRNGHLAFNEPGTALSSRTHLATLAPATRDRHAAAFGGRAVPERALTAGIQTILGARSILFAATGAVKAAAVKAALFEPIDPACPASALRLHDRVTVVLDEAAAASLPASTRWSRPPLELRDRSSIGSELKTLVVAPHPDDASISCGGLIAMLRPGRGHVATFSTGAHAIAGTTVDAARLLRESESRAEARALGAGISFLRARGYGSGAFEPTDAADLADVFRSVAPRRILAPSRSDPHPTHRLCRLTIEDALLRATTAASGPIELWTFEGPWLLHEREAINVVVKLDPAAHAAKQQGIQAHASQVRRVPFDAGSEALERLRALAFSESHFGGRFDGGYDPSTRVECYGRIVVS